MDFKIYKAKTVNDAITEALIDLEITSDKIEYEVIEEGSSGLLGLFSKEAMIKAWKKEEIMLEEQEEDYFDIKSQFRTDSAPLLTPQKAKPARKSKNSGASQESRKNHDQAEKPVREEKQPREDRLAREDSPVKEDKPQKQTQKKAAPVSEEKEPVPATLDEPYANPAIENVMQTIFRKLDKATKDDCILATNTSSISITEIASAVEKKENVIGMHFFNPPVAMKLIEVIRGGNTSDEVYETVFALAQEIGKTPVTVSEAPGFVCNRLLIPMLNEAIELVQNGVASAEDIDTAMRLGCNHPMGPLTLADFIGLDTCLAIMDTIYEETHDSKYRASLLLRKMVRAGKLGNKTGEGFFKH